MLASLETFQSLVAPRSNVVVVGAGAVGLCVAVKLARAGRQVTLLEAGSRGLRHQSQSLFEAMRSVGKPHEGIHSGRFRMLGGTTNFWGGQLVPFDAAIFAARPWLRDDTAWPIARAELDPYYGEALDLLGMARCIHDDAEVLARLSLPVPPLDADLRYYFTRWAPRPVLSEHFEGELRELAGLTCFFEAPVAALGLGDAGGTVDHVEAIDGSGRRIRFPADQVVLANGTIEIARLLRAPAAGGGAAPWSANRWLGRGFMDHLDVTVGRMEVIDQAGFHNAFENVVLDGIKYQPKIRLAPAAQARDGLVDISAHLIFNSSYAEHFANAKIFLKSMLRGRFDRNLRSYPARIWSLIRVGLPMAMRYIRDNRVYSPADLGIDLRLAAEQIMVAESRIVPTGRTDAIGMEIYDIDWRIDGRELETMAVFAGKIAAALEDAGLARVTLDPRLAARDPGVLEDARDTNHQMGMARMASDPEQGVVDAELRMFGSRNLSVVGAAVYPSCGFANPTFTAIALGLRLADRLLAGPAGR